MEDYKKNKEYENLYEKYKSARDRLFGEQSKLRFWPQTVEDATITEDADHEILLPGDLGIVNSGNHVHDIVSAIIQKGSITLTLSPRTYNQLPSFLIPTEDAEFEIIQPKQLK